MPEKVISFRGEDRGIYSLLDNLRRQMSSLREEMAKDSDSYSDSVKKAISSIEEEISVLEKRNRLIRDSKELVRGEEFRRGRVGAEDAPLSRQIAPLREREGEVRGIDDRGLLERISQQLLLIKEAFNIEGESFLAISKQVIESLEQEIDLLRERNLTESENLKERRRNLEPPRTPTTGGPTKIPTGGAPNPDLVNVPREGEWVWREAVQEGEREWDVVKHGTLEQIPPGARIVGRREKGVIVERRPEEETGDFTRNVEPPLEPPPPTPPIDVAGEEEEKPKPRRGRKPKIIGEEVRKEQPPLMRNEWVGEERPPKPREGNWVWNEAKRDWEQIFEMPSQEEMTRRMYDPEWRKQWYGAAEERVRRFIGIQEGGKEKVGIDIEARGAEEASEQLQKVREEAKNLSEELIKSAIENTRTSREATTEVERGIASLERKKKLELEEERYFAEEKYLAIIGDAKTNPRQKEQALENYYQQIAEIKKEEKETSLESKILREILTTIKETANKELQSDREGVEKTIAAFEAEELTLSPEEELKVRMQKEILKEEKEEEEGEERRRGTTGIFGGVLGGSFLGTFLAQQLQNMAGTIANVATQRNEMYMITSLLALIPFVGQGLSSLMDKALSEAEGYGRALGGMAAIRGRGMEEFRGIGKEAEDYGFTYQEFLEAMKPISMAIGVGGGDRLRRETEMFLQLTKGTPVSREDLLEIARLQRYGGEGMFQTVQRGIYGGRAAGVIAGEDFSLLPEYLKILVSLGREQAFKLGKIDTGINAAVVDSLASLGDVFKNPELLGQLVPIIEKGLETPVTPQVEALQFAALSQVFPGASLWEMEKMREKGVAAYNPKTQETYLETLLNNLRQVSAGDETFYRNIFYTFSGISRTLAEDLGKGFIEKEKKGGFFEPEVWAKKIEAERKGEVPFEEQELLKRAIESTTVLDRSTAHISNIFQTTGDSLARNMKSLEEAILKWIEKLTGEDESKASALAARNAQVNEELVRDLKESGKALDKIGSMFIQRNQIHMSYIR